MLTAATRIGTLVVAVGLLAITMPEEAWSRAGGVLGGILGGMLFRSLGFAGGYGGFGGGFGLMDLLLLGGIGYLIYWVVNRGQRSEEATATSSYPHPGGA